MISFRVSIPLHLDRQAKTNIFLVAMKDLLGETAEIAQEELRKKQTAINELHAELRGSSTRVGETRRKIEVTREKLKQQQLYRQIEANLSRELEKIQYRMGAVEQGHAQQQSSSAAAWEDELSTAIENASATAPTSSPSDSFEKSATTKTELPDINVLRARLKATGDVLAAMTTRYDGLKGTSRDIEYKYRRLVALAASCPEEEVDKLLESLVRAVQSEKGELEIGRVRKFLGGVDGV